MTIKILKSEYLEGYTRRCYAIVAECDGQKIDFTYQPDVDNVIMHKCYLVERDKIKVYREEIRQRFQETANV